MVPLADKKPQKLIPFALILLQSLLYGFGDPISKAAYERMPVCSLLAVRYFIAFAVLMLIAGKRVIRELRSLRSHAWIAPSVCIAVSYVLSNLALRLTAATSVAFLRSLATVMTPLLALLFCVGAMTIVGSLNAGLTGDNTLIFTKSILDLISSCLLASTLGIGVMFAAVFVLLVQGGLVLLAGLLQNVLTDQALIAEITFAGSVMIIGLGLNILGITKLKVANFLPALLLVPLFYRLIQLLPI